MAKWDYLVEGDADFRTAEREWKGSPSEDALLLYLNVAARYNREPTIELTTLTSEMIQSSDVRQLLADLKPGSFTYKGRTMSKAGALAVKYVRDADIRYSNNMSKVKCYMVTYSTKDSLPFCLVTEGVVSGYMTLVMFHHLRLSNLNGKTAGVRHGHGTSFSSVSGETLLNLDNGLFKRYGVPIYWTREAPSWGAVNGWIKAGK